MHYGCCPCAIAGSVSQVSTADLVEYKSSVKAAIRRAAAEVERDWGGPAVPGEWLLLYVRPFELDPGDKGAA